MRSNLTGPRFHRMGKKYPLTNFRAFLLRAERSPHTVTAYVSAIRQLLAHVEGPDGAPQWRDFDRVGAYSESLRWHSRTVLQSAWNHWLDFTAAPLPPLARGGKRGQQCLLATTLHVLLPFLKNAGASLRGQLLEWRWRDAQTLEIGTQGLWRIPPHLREPFAAILSWGRPEGDRGWFLPAEPGSPDAMALSKLNYLLDSCVDAALAQELQAGVQQALKAALKQGS